MTEIDPKVLEFLRHSKMTLVLIVSMNRAERRRAGWLNPKQRYEAQLTRVLRDLGEIA